MRRVTPLLVLAFAAFAACADGAVAPSEDASFARIHEAEGSQGGTPFMVLLTPGAEVPGPGDPSATGVMVLTLNSGQQEICFKTSFSGLSTPVSAAHIHTAPAGFPGPVLVPLAPPAFPAVTSGVVAQCVFAPREVIKAIRKNPENFYVNIHSVGLPAGAIRGQLFRTQGSNVNHF